MFRLELPPPVAEVVRHLPPDLKRAVKLALRALSVEPEAGVPLAKELEGLWKYWVRRFRIVYSIDRAHRVMRILAVGHRRDIYQEIVEQLRAASIRRR